MDSSLEKKIINLKEKSVSELAELFHCREDEICLSDYIARKTSDTVCPYKVIMGYANFEDSLVTDLGKLEVVVGKETLETNAQNQRIVSIRQLFEDNFIKSANGFERREINPSND